MYIQLTLLIIIFDSTGGSVVGYACFGNRTWKKLDVVFPITAFLEKHNTVASIFGLSSEKCH